MVLAPATVQRMPARLSRTSGRWCNIRSRVLLHMGDIAELRCRMVPRTSPSRHVDAQSVRRPDRTRTRISAVAALLVLMTSAAAAQTSAAVSVSRAQRVLGGESRVIPVSWYGISAVVSQSVIGRVGVTGSYSWWGTDDVVGDTIVVGATYRLGSARWRVRPSVLAGAWRTARAGASWAPAWGGGFSWGGRFGGTFGTAFMRPRGLTYAVSRIGVYYWLP